MTAPTATPAPARRDPAVEAARAVQLAAAHMAVCPVCRAGGHLITRPGGR